MAKGVKTGGRKAGVPNKVTLEREQQIAASGLTPLDYMLSLVRDDALETSVRLDAAKGAAPYSHPKLASVELSGKEGAAPIGLTLDMRVLSERTLREIAAAAVQ